MALSRLVKGCSARWASCTRSSCPNWWPHWGTQTPTLFAASSLTTRRRYYRNVGIWLDVATATETLKMLSRWGCSIVKFVSYVCTRIHHWAHFILSQEPRSCCTLTRFTCHGFFFFVLFLLKLSQIDSAQFSYFHLQLKHQQGLKCLSSWKRKRC